MTICSPQFHMQMLTRSETEKISKQGPSIYILIKAKFPPWSLGESKQAIGHF